MSYILRKITNWISILQNYGKFWSISLGHLLSNLKSVIQNNLLKINFFCPNFNPEIFGKKYMSIVEIYIIACIRNKVACPDN